MVPQLTIVNDWMLREATCCNLAYGMKVFPYLNNVLKYIVTYLTLYNLTKRNLKLKPRVSTEFKKKLINLI